jgi:hypothetical protein
MREATSKPRQRLLIGVAVAAHSTVDAAIRDEVISFRIFFFFAHIILGLICPICNLGFGAARALTSLITVQLFKSDFDGVSLEDVNHWLFRA